MREERKVGGKTKKYIVFILGVSNNSGNKHQEKKRHSLFYVATCHFSTWMMDVSLLHG